MRTSSNGLESLKLREGCVLHAYRDSVGVLTIGYGHTGPDVTPGLVWTQDQADAALASRLRDEFEPAVNTVKVPLTQNQFDALVSFAYNVGVGAFKGSTLLRKLNASDYAGASAEFPKWCIPKEIVGRRQQERRQFDDIPVIMTADIQRIVGVSPVDGVFGPKTRDAVIDFQKANDLEPDGVVGPKTLAKMASTDKSPLASAARWIGL